MCKNVNSSLEYKNPYFAVFLFLLTVSSLGLHLTHWKTSYSSGLTLYGQGYAFTNHVFPKDVMSAGLTGSLLLSTPFSLWISSQTFSRLIIYSLPFEGSFLVSQSSYNCAPFYKKLTTTNSLQVSSSFFMCKAICVEKDEHSAEKSFQHIALLCIISLPLSH